ncbi:MAG: DMT family transporter, partial [Rhodospirillaceae bacterium]|nr:DMT family transporter [Rhodospirillaceae bacterium]
KLSELRGGELLILLGLCLFNWYAIGAQRWMTGVSQLGIAAITVAISAIAMTVALPFLILTGISEVQYSLDGRSIAYVLYLGAGPAAFALFCWHWGVSRCGVTVAAIYTNLAPIVVVTIRMIEGEPPKTEHLIGGGLIIAGVLIAQLMPAVPGRRQTREAT